MSLLLLGLLLGPAERGGPAPASAPARAEAELGRPNVPEAAAESAGEPMVAPPALGLFPTVGGAFGLPAHLSSGAGAYLSVGRDGRFSYFVGYGVERGEHAQCRLVTLGLGGVRELQVAGHQLGFFGKFLRYRRWDLEHHGRHYGLSLGTETGVGHLALAFELGVARSSPGHWLLTAEVAVKLAFPLRLVV